MLRGYPLPRKFRSAGVTAIALLLLATSFLILRTSAEAVAAGAVPGQVLPARVRVADNVSIAANATATVTIAGVGGLPASNLASVILNIGAKGDWFNSGELRVYASDKTEPATAAASYTPNTYGAAGVVTKVGADGKIKVTNHSTNVVKVYLDVHGYTRSDSEELGGTFVPVSPVRLVNDQSVGAYANYEFNPLGQAGVPASGVQAVAVTLTTKNPTNTGTLRMFTAGELLPADSDIEYAPNAYTTAHTVAKLGTTGAVNLHNASISATKVWVDIVGYYAKPGTAVNRGVLKPVDPARIVTEVSVAANSDYEFTPLGKGGVPNSVATSAVSLNLTANSTGDGILRLVPTGVDPGANHTLAYAAGKAATVPTTTKLGTDGKVTIRNTGTTAVKVSVDVTGYYGSAPGTPLLSASPLASDGDATSVLASTTPTLKATGTDPDGAPLDYLFEVAPEGSTTPIASGNVTAVASGADASWTVPAGVLRSPGSYLFRAKATDVTGAWAYTYWARFGIDATVTPTELDVSLSDPTSPVLSGVVSRASEREIEARFYLFNNNGTAIGQSPFGTSTALGGARAGLRIPQGQLTAGQTYKWQMEACSEGACAPRTEILSFTVPGEPGVPTQTLTLGSPQITVESAKVGATACATAPCALAPSTAVELGGSGDEEKVSRLKFDLTSIPAGAEVESASLTLGTPSCGTACPAEQTAGLYDLVNDFPVAPTGLDVVQGLSADALVTSALAPSTFDVTTAVPSRDALAVQGLAVRATVGDTVSYPTSGIQLTVKYRAAHQPGQIAAVEARAGDGGVLAKWSPPIDIGADTTIDGYDVRVLDASNTVVKEATSTDTSLIVGGLANDGQYKVQVRTKTAFGTGAWALSGQVTTAAVPGGAQKFIDGVRQFVESQQGLIDGQFADLAAAITASSRGDLFKDALTVVDDDLKEEKQSLATNDITRVDSSVQLSDVLVSYDQTAGTVTVRSALDTSTTDQFAQLGADEEQPGPVTVVKVVDYLFSLGAGAQPQVQGPTTPVPVLSVLKDGDSVDAMDDATSVSGENVDDGQAAGLLEP